MRLSISNIAWKAPLDTSMATLLRRHGVDAIDVAPSRYFEDLRAVTAEQIKVVRQFWNDQGIQMVGAQSLLFGTKGLSVFGDSTAVQGLLDHLQRVFAVGAQLGISRYVFGSPANRDRGDRPLRQAMDEALPVFVRMGNLAAQHGAVLCVEPNPPEYGCNFLINTAEAATFTQSVNHPAVRIQMDLGAVMAAGDDPMQVSERYATLVGHVHLSERGLKPLGSSDGNFDHARAGAAFRQFLCSKDRVFCIEMREPEGGDELAVIDNSLSFARRHYLPLNGPTSDE